MTTFIFGHKNPDTDSVCSSIALSYLKNEQGGKTAPKVLGNINNETKFVLNYFKVPVPSYLNDVRVRIKNIKYDKRAYIFDEESIDEAFKMMQHQNLTAIPLVDNKKKLSGYVTLKEIAKYLISGNKEIVNTTLDNIIETLDAKVIVKCDDLISGDILIAGLQSKTIEKSIQLSSRDILIVGDRYKVLNYAIESKVKLIILPLNVNVDKKIIKKAEKNNINIIASEYDSFQIANKILLSNFIKNINMNKNPITVNNEDYFTDFKNMTHRVNHSNYPVVNNKGECLGLIRLTGPNNFEKQKVILVDHNNFAQSVDGLDEADILEIIDHHNLGAINTSLPINFRSKPVGSTSTMIYEMYKEQKVSIPKDIAGLMLSAILSDTLLLTSPTTTEDDKFAAVKLANIAKVDIDKYGLEMLKAASSIEGKSVEELIKTDFKSYVVGDKLLGISQIMTLDIEAIEKNVDEFIAKLNEMVSLNYSMVTIFITDIIKNGSYVLYNDAAAEIIKDSFGLKNIHQCIFLPKIVSRKKQIQPNIISILEGD
ncbi:MAG TPA: putative manganese-dependent inorganic diphosphatase [Candidatus Onthocola stercoravium]|nr:putative manganese-dependent inorganic diphosphatase [Candidatus Onthocola stercoravium]